MRNLLLVAPISLVLASCGSHPNQSASFSLQQSDAIPRSGPILIESVESSPVIERGTSGQWDSVDVLNPSVIRKDGKYINYYSGYDGKVWHTGIATSPDGKHWDKFSGNPVLSPGDSWDTGYIAANGSAIEWKGQMLYLYHGVSSDEKPRIGLATSKDGFAFTKTPSPVLDVGAKDSWEEYGVGDPYVVADGGKLYMYYLGMDKFHVQRLGVAISNDGVTWTKSNANPIMDVGVAGSFDEAGLGEPSVVYSAPFFYMIYTGRSAQETRDIGYAVSNDGVHWKKMSYNGLFGDKWRAAWDSKVICDTTILANDDGTFTVWFGGGDKPRPGQDLNGQIGSFSVRLSPASNGYDANKDYTSMGIRPEDVLFGSFDPEGDAVARSAWVGPKTSLTISKSSAEKELVVKGWMPYSFYKKAGVTGPVRISVKINGTEAQSHEFTSDEVFSIKVSADQMEKLGSGSDRLKISVDTDHSFNPKQIFGSPDERELSMKVSSIQLAN